MNTNFLSPDDREIKRLRAKLRDMHRRAQKAEGKLARMEAAHVDACEYAFRSYIDYALYGSLLLNMNPSLFPKLKPAALRSREVNGG